MWYGVYGVVDVVWLICVVDVTYCVFYGCGVFDVDVDMMVVVLKNYVVGVVVNDNL